MSSDPAFPWRGWQGARAFVPLVLAGVVAASAATRTRIWAIGDSGIAESGTAPALETTITHTRAPSITGRYFLRLRIEP